MPCRKEVEGVLVEIFVFIFFDFLEMDQQTLSIKNHTVNILGRVALPL